MLELTDWIASSGFPERPWLMLGKGPTIERRHTFDLGEYNLLSLNHVVNEVPVDVAHIIDMDVVEDCAEHLGSNCEWLVMPRYPHLRSEVNSRRLEEWFDYVPVLRELDERGRLVWYNLSDGRPEGRSPVIGAKGFSSEAALRILGLLGARSVRSLGIDGGRSYGASFKQFESSTLMANGMPAFDLQFERLEVLVEEFGIDYRPLVEPLRIFIGTDESQIVAHRVLEYSIRKTASVPVEITPMLDFTHRMPKDPENKPRTKFSFGRFMIPELCGYRGRALYLDADMVVFEDIAELADLPFGDHKVMCTQRADMPSAWSDHGGVYLGPRSLAVMLLDCGELPWKVDDIVAGLDEGRYSYQELMSDLCVVAPSEIGETIPPEWNDLETFEVGRTKLLHYTVVPTQPWKNDDNPLGEIWMSMYREAVEAGAVPPEEVEMSIAAGHVKPSLRAVLRSAPSRRTVLTGASLDLVAAHHRVTELESRLAAMRSSWDWRIGRAVAGALRLPRKALRRITS